ncbi:MAG: phosphate ABC transporter ATP-binding protein [Rhizobiales bacterium 35-66-30]|nr:MAG: phosphate ABC transporter ATP-binding protein [Rhizobiales bacterium 35-66-30]
MRKNFGALAVLKGIDLDVAPGEVVALIGRSGSGKSTALRCVNGLEKVDGGELTVCGRALHSGTVDLRELRQDVGIVFQSYNLFPHLTVEQNVTLAPRKVKRIGKGEARDLAAEVLAQVGLADKAQSYPEQLSGGQQQRVAIARVTHEMAFARSVAHAVVFMHQGKVWESGKGEMLANPQTVELRQFVGNGL